MESPELGLIRGFVVDSSVLVRAERGKLTTPEVIRNLQQAAGDVAIVICALTVAELGHGIYHAREESKSQQRRRFLDELKQHVPIHPITAATAEIVARIGGEQAVKGITVPFADLIIGACALELGCALATHNVRHFRLIPGLDVRQFWVITNLTTHVFSAILDTWNRAHFRKPSSTFRTPTTAANIS